MSLVAVWLQTLLQCEIFLLTLFQVAGNKQRHRKDALSDLELSRGNTTYSQVIGDTVAFE
jgi:cell division septal protein FtsQ